VKGCRKRIKTGHIPKVGNVDTFTDSTKGSKSTSEKKKENSGGAGEEMHQTIGKIPAEGTRRFVKGKR